MRNMVVPSFSLLDQASQWRCRYLLLADSGPLLSIRRCEPAPGKTSADLHRGRQPQESHPTKKLVNLKLFTDDVPMSRHIPMGFPRCVGLRAQRLRPQRLRRIFDGMHPGIAHGGLESRRWPEMVHGADINYQSIVKYYKYLESISIYKYL